MQLESVSLPLRNAICQASPCNLHPFLDFKKDWSEMSLGALCIVNLFKTTRRASSSPNIVTSPAWLHRLFPQQRRGRPHIRSRLCCLNLLAQTCPPGFYPPCVSSSAALGSISRDVTMCSSVRFAFAWVPLSPKRTGFVFPPLFSSSSSGIN